MPAVGMFHQVAQEFEGYGSALKEKCREHYGTYISVQGRGEMIPNEKSYCEIDPKVVDCWGIPVLRFHFAWTENDVRMAADMNETFKAIIEAAGGTPVTEKGSDESPYGHLYPGGVAHEVGTVRMGADRRTSVLNRFCQAHDVNNLFVTDGACFASNPDKNPTATIMALSWRASDYLLDQMKKQNL